MDNATKITACFAPAYEANTPTASMRKLGPVARAVEAAGLAELVNPGSIDPDKLRRLHAPNYVDAFLSGDGHLASSQGWSWTPQIRDGVLAIQAGQLLGARLALERGIAANIAQGFHHARYRSGSGFCTFNGLALVANENPDLKVFVLDCDQHEGDGTAEFTEHLANLWNFSINGSCFGSKAARSTSVTLPPVTTEFACYRDALYRAFDEILAIAPDLVIYQAGVDCHINDPLGTLGLTTEQLFARDEEVLRFLRASGIPCLFVLAGGYQEPIETRLLPLHVGTFLAAKRVWSDSECLLRAA